MTSCMRPAGTGVDRAVGSTAPGRRDDMVLGLHVFRSRTRGRPKVGLTASPVGLWQYLNAQAVAFGTSSGNKWCDSPSTMRANQNYLVWFAGVQWDAIRGTDRHMVTALSRLFNILWVDPPVSPVASTRGNDVTHRPFRPRLSAASDRVMRLTPVALPGLTRWGVRATTAPLVRVQVRWAIRRTGIRPLAVVATRLDDVLGRWGNDVLDVLYGTDDYVAGAELMKLPVRWLQVQEKRALTRADVVIAISDQLADRWVGLGAAPLIIPNGCCDAPEHGGVLPPEALRLPRPLVGLVGQLSDRIDLDIVEAIVEAGFSLLVVGPKDPRWEPERFANLISRPGVYFTGRVPAEEVPSYLATIDVGITPYRDSPFNRASFPLKTLEYLSAGRPVVSTGLRSARWLKADLVTRQLETDDEQILALADDAASFVDAVRSLTGGTREPGAAKYHLGTGRVMQGRADSCRRFANVHSWSRRADAFASAIGLPGSQSDPEPESSRPSHG